jgi:hypothetical protein
MKTWTIPDRKPDTPGPWQDEPDKVQWIDEASGLDCLIVRNHVGALCGYVGVPPGHTWHGQDYDDVPADVHGGLTYANRCQEDQEHGICHIPEPGRPDDVWWLGFDCAHFGDLAPGVDANVRKLGLSERGGIYRDLAYVRAQVAYLARQAVTAESAS